MGAVVLLVIGVLTAIWITTAGPRNDVPPPSPSPVLPAPVAAEPELPGWIVLSWTLEGIGKPNLRLFRPDGSERFQVTDVSIHVEPVK